ncbi:MAG: tetratricopeptide repeat protein, partial [Candidatus Omnitrophota bacterium]
LYDQALKQSHPDRLYNLKIYNNLAILKAEKGHYSEAKALLKQALNIASSEGDRYKAARMLYMIANVDSIEGNYQAAVFGYQKAIAMVSDEDAFFGGLGYAYIMLGDRDNAMLALRKALRMNPENENARHNLSLMLGGGM